MGRVTDLTGSTYPDGFGGTWTVVEKAPAENRAAAWWVKHDCGNRVRRQHVSIRKMCEGTYSGAESPCPECAATPKLDALIASDLMNGLPDWTLSEEPLVIEASWGTYTLPPAAGPRPGWDLTPYEADDSQIEETVLATDVRGAAAFGKAEAIGEAQAILDVVRRYVTQPAKPAKYTVGASSIGMCGRKLAHRMLYGRDAVTAWRPFVGTQTHRGLDDACQADNRARVSAVPEEAAGLQGGRWITGVKIVKPCWGEIDVYDGETATVLDFKVPGITAVKRTWKGDLDETYQGQLDVYGLGLTMLGYPVEWVAAFVLPAAGELEDAAWYSRAWDPGNAIALVERRAAIAASVGAAWPDGPGAHDEVRDFLATIGAREDHCGHCPVLAAGLCPGIDVRPPAPALVEGWTNVVTPPPGVAGKSAQ